MNSEKKESKIPIPYALSQWDSRTEVLYKCPKCGCNMALLGSIQNFCYNCGQELDWEFCIRHVTDKIKEEYWGAEIAYHRQKISYNGLKKFQNDIMFEIYEFACRNKREKQK